MDSNGLQGSVVPFARRWHVIQELDLVRLIAGHRLRAGLCNRLETLADALPALPGHDDLEALCDMLTDLIEEGDPAKPSPLAALLPGSREDHLAAALITRIRARRADDAAAADELIAALLPADAADSRPAGETLGYMIRCFTTGCRRAIEFEQLAVVALAGHRLTPDARAVLVGSLAEAQPADHWPARSET